MRFHLIFVLLTTTTLLIGQDNAKKIYYIYSNVVGKSQDPTWNFLASDLMNIKHKTNIISLGNNSSEFISYMNATCPNCKTKYLSGDKHILEHLALDKLLTEQNIKRWTHKSSCPDPVVHNIDKNNVFIAINSNWFVERDMQYHARDQNCQTYNSSHFFEALESLIEDYSEKNIFILSHHNTQSVTQIGGKRLGQYHWIPIFGLFYASYRKNIGKQQDLGSPLYHAFAKRMNELCYSYENIYLISGHDLINTYINDNNYRGININSGISNYAYSKNESLKYVNKNPAYLKLEFYNKHPKMAIVTEDSIFEIPMEKKNLIHKDDITIDTIRQEINLELQNASDKYGTGAFQQFLMGSGYRAEWVTPIKAKPLQLSRVKGGLKPYARGGGLQTLSVKFRNHEGRKYAFRMLDKAPEKSLGEIARNSVYKDIVQELITTMHPYGPLVAYELIKETDIIHIKPELYIMDYNQEELKGYDGFSGKLGTLEEKPKGRSKKKHRPGFAGADKVVSSHEMFIKLRKSYKNTLDKTAYAHARVFDMFIGDWDRHEDNWKWAQFKGDQQNIFKPIPKDRDHVFSLWNGFIPSAADLAVPNAESFEYKFGNLKQLNFKALYLDRQLASELTLDDWLEAAEYIRAQMTDEVIDNALKALPNEVADFSNDEIEDKLKSRKKDLNRAIKIFYKNLSKEVEIRGTNKRDYFEIIRQPSGRVLVNVYDSNGDRQKKYYSRRFDPEVTKTIYCYGLDAVDIFHISGQVDQSIKLRIITGNDADIVVDESSVNGRLKITQIYDSSGEDIIQTSHETIIKKPKKAAHYDPYAYTYDMLLPLPGLRNSSGNGFGIDLRTVYVKQGFNKPGYAKKYELYALYYPNIGAYRIDAKYQYRHLINNADLFLEGRFSTQYDKFPFFYGLGNSTIYNNEYRENGQYKLDYNYMRFDIGLENEFLRKSKWTNSLFIEYHDVKSGPNNITITTENQGIGNALFYGLRSDLSIDFTDNVPYPLDGNRFNIGYEVRTSDKGTLSGKISADISYFKTLNLGVNTTFIVRLMHQSALGDVNFYHKSALGSSTHLRGYSRNRFLDRHATNYNTEIRLNLGTIRTPLIQMIVGVFGLYDGGKVYANFKDFSKENWKNSYGGGFFVAPGKTDYALSFSMSWSEDNRTHSKIKLGFDF